MLRRARGRDGGHLDPGLQPSSGWTPIGTPHDADQSGVNEKFKTPPAGGRYRFGRRHDGPSVVSEPDTTMKGSERRW